MTAIPLGTLPALDLESELDKPWSTTVWDDPINLMSYVTYVFMEYFKFSKEKADYHMLMVHTEPLLCFQKMVKNCQKVILLLK